MKVFRISKAKYRKDLSGKGAELFGGRWNPIGIPALYTSENRALCALEILAHTPKDFLPPKYIIQAIQIPKDLESLILALSNKELPRNWDSIQNIRETEELGKTYFENNYLGIIVPSVIIKQEKNIVLNPLHPKYAEIKITEEISFSIDDRLIK